MCEYSLNPCYMNDICGRHGRCVNLYYKFYCDCSTSLFFEGKFCEKSKFKRGNTTAICLSKSLTVSCYFVITITLFHHIQENIVSK